MTEQPQIRGRWDSRLSSRGLPFTVWVLDVTEQRKYSLAEIDEMRSCISKARYTGFYNPDPEVQLRLYMQCGASLEDVCAYAKEIIDCHARWHRKLVRQPSMDEAA
jgi:hypothetical protein